MLKFTVITIFPRMLDSALGHSILKKAQEKGLIEVAQVDLRAYTHDRHHVTDDTPYGGGGGMVMKPEPVFEAVESDLGPASNPAQPPPTEGTRQGIPVILLTPQGRVFTQ